MSSFCDIFKLSDVQVSSRQFDAKTLSRSTFSMDALNCLSLQIFENTKTIYSADLQHYKEVVTADFKKLHHIQSGPWFPRVSQVCVRTYFQC